MLTFVYVRNASVYSPKYIHNTELYTHLICIIIIFISNLLQRKKTKTKKKKTKKKIVIKKKTKKIVALKTLIINIKLGEIKMKYRTSISLYIIICIIYDVA